MVDSAATVEYRDRRALIPTRSDGAGAALDFRQLFLAGSATVPARLEEAGRASNTTREVVRSGIDVFPLDALNHTLAVR
eukprot:93364-Prorocentrum_minimum.AAC.1